MKTGVLSVLVTAVATEPRKVPGTWQDLNKYLLNE